MAKKKENKAAVGDHDTEGLIELPQELSAAFWRKLGQIVMNPAGDWMLSGHVGLTVLGFVLGQADKHDAKAKGCDEYTGPMTRAELAACCEDYAAQLECDHPPKGFTIQPWMIEAALLAVQYLQRWLQGKLPGDED